MTASDGTLHKASLRRPLEGGGEAGAPATEHRPAHAARQGALRTQRVAARPYGADPRRSGVARRGRAAGTPARGLGGGSPRRRPMAAEAVVELRRIACARDGLIGGLDGASAVEALRRLDRYEGSAYAKKRKAFRLLSCDRIIGGCHHEWV
jgi:hypothetical protein